MSLHALQWSFRVAVDTSSQRIVLVTLADAANDDGECWISINSTLVTRTRLSRRHIIDVIRELETAGYLKRIERHRDNGSQTSNQYKLNVPPIIEYPRPEQEAPPLCMPCTPPVHAVHPPCAPGAPPDPSVDPSIDPKKEKKDTHSTVLTFGEFANVQLTETQYGKVKARMNGHTEIVIEQLSRYGMQFPKKFAQYKSHYATLLNWYDRALADGRLRTVTDPDAAREQHIANVIAKKRTLG